MRYGYEHLYTSGVSKEDVERLMKKFLCKYDEYGKGFDFPSMREFFQETRYDGQREIVDYLKAGKVGNVSGGADYDAFNPDRYIGEKLFQGDNEFGWCSSLPYYIETYNLRLPPEIEARLLAKIRAERGVSQPTADTPSK